MATDKGNDIKPHIKFIIDTVESLKEDNTFSWEETYELFQQQYPEINITQEGMRSLYRYHMNQGKYRTKHRERVTGYKTRQEGWITIQEKILNLVKNKHSFNELHVRLGITQEELYTEITKLELSGIVFDKWNENGKPYIRLNAKKLFPTYGNTTKLEVENEVKFLVISDTHIGHKKARRQEVNELINLAYSKGVRTVFHVGDVTEGHYMSVRPTSIKELEVIGFDEQVELADNTFPRLEGLTYYGISGNHDFSFDRNAFANPVKTLARIRPDFKYLGHNFAKIELTPKVDITLVHPDDGIGQNYALKLMQHIDRNRPERLGRFIFMGHYHKFTHLHYRNRDAWVVPSFIDQTNFMETKNLESVVGGFIMSLKLDKNGDLISFVPEYFFYEPLEDDK